MPPSKDRDPSTCWTMIRDAAAGDEAGREEFARRYIPAIEAYLRARWKGPSADEVADAVQEVFVECLKTEGALQRARPDPAGSFRGFLYGIARNVARRFEERRRARHDRDGGALDLSQLKHDEASLSRVFDRAWAESVMREAARVMRQRAETAGGDAARRVEILRLRFQEDRPIRDIARDLDLDAAHTHHEYARARAEFRDALVDVMSHFHPEAPGAAQREAAELVALLQ